LADVDDTLPEWSSTTASNKPTGGTTVGTGWDDNLREIQGVTVRWLSHKGSDIASAATTDIGAVEGLMHDITGTTTITGLGTIRAGIWKILKFEGALTLTHNATSLILPGGVNITTADGDIGIFASEGSGNWRCVSYMRNGGAAISVKGYGNIPINASIAASVATNELTVALKGANGSDPSGSNPVLIPFRDTTAATGSYSFLLITSALSITVPDTGTLGTVSADMARLYIYAVNDGGTARLGIYNPVSGSGSTVALKGLNCSAVQTSTQVGVGSDSAQTLYTNGAAATDKAVCWLGFVEIVEATAGTWATAPSLVVNAGIGIPYTGHLVQVVNDIEDTGGTTTSSALADVSGASASITPSSRCNLLECHVDFTQTCASQTASSAGSTAAPADGSDNLYRSAKILKTTDTASEPITTASGSFHFYAKPDSTSAQTVKLRHASTNNSDTITTADVGIMVKEIFA
jgi:hypothetical protein